MAERRDLVTEFCRRLLEEGGAVRAGVPEARLRIFEQLNHVTLPADMRIFYLGTDGMEYEFPFESFVRVLPIDEVVPVKREFPGHQPEDAFLIGDAMISAHFYAIDVAGTAGAAGSVYLADPQPLRVTRSFAEFVEEVLSDSRRLYHGDQSV
jgi:hypothetical protein